MASEPYRILLFDIDAHAAGCTAIGVATGRHDAADLREAGADHVTESMEQPLPL